MSDGQTPQDRLPDDPGEPVAGAPQDVSSASASANQGPSSEPLTGAPRSKGRRAPTGAGAGVVSPSAATAAASAVSAAMAATAAGKGKAKPPLTAQNKVPATPSGFPSIIRASLDEPKEEVSGEAVDEMADDLAISPLVPVPPSVTDEPNRRYMRPVPEVPGIIRASREESALAEDLAKATPIFSNEGIVRAAAARRRNRVLAPITDLGGVFLDAGSALGHSIASNVPGGKMAVAGAGASGRVASPDFDKYGNPRQAAGNRRALALVGVAGLIIAALAVSYMFLPGPDLNGFPLIPDSSNDTKDVIHGGTANPDDPDAIVIGDASGGPNSGGRARSAAPTSTDLPYCDELPTPTPTPTPTATPSSSTSPTPTTTPTPKPTPIPCRTREPRVTHVPSSSASAGPTGSATASAGASPTGTGAPTPTPTPTATPTPTPTPVVMFALLYSITPPAAAGQNGTFWVMSLTGASCVLHRAAVPGFDPVQRNSGAFAITRTDGWAKVNWPVPYNWPPSLGGAFITAWVTCTLSGYPDATSDQVTATAPWP